MKIGLNFVLTFFTTVVLSLDLVICSPLKVSQIKAIRVNDDIIKPSTDHRSYRSLELANDLKILIVNDPDLGAPVVTWDVNVGYMNYPKNAPSLARYLDENFFLEAATKKYPEEGQFLKFLNAHQADILNYGFIYANHANLEFTLDLSDLPEALDRFAQLFISPQFSLNMFKRTADRELLDWSQEINAEGKEKYQRRNGVYPYAFPWKYLLRSLCNKTHDFYLPLMKNEESTPEGLVALFELAMFYEKYYSANLMTIVIMSNQSLDYMTALSVPIFSSIRNKHIAQPSWSTNPYGPGQLGYRIEIETKQLNNEFKILFPTDDYSSHFMSKPWEYVSRILHNFRLSILDKELIKDKKLLVSFDVKYNVQAKGVAFYEISGMLTEKGLNKFEEVLEIIMQYINYLKTQKMRKWIVKQIEEDHSTHFRLSGSAIDGEFFMIRVATDLHNIPPKYVISNKYMLDEYRPDLIEKFLSHLNADNLNIYLFSKTFKGKTDKVEKWSNTKYRMRKISEELLEKLRLKNSEFYDYLYFSEPSPFIPENFSILKSDDLINSSYPKIIHESAIGRIWHLKDNFYLYPKVYLYFKLRSPVSNSSPLNSALCFIFAKMMDHTLSSITKDGELGHLEYVHTAVLNSEFALSVEGYNDKMPEFIASMFEFMTLGNFDYEYFQKLKQWPLNATNDMAVHDLFYDSLFYRITDLYSNILMSPNKWSPTDFYGSFKEITLEEITEFMGEFFSNLHIELFAYGNINKEGALNVMKSAIGSIQKRFTIHPLLMTENKRISTALLPEGKSFLYETLTNDSISAVHVTFQAKLNINSLKDIALNALISRLLFQSCMEITTSDEKRSPDTFMRCGFKKENGIHKIKFYIQDYETPETLDLRIERIIKNIEENTTFYNPYFFEELDHVDQETMMSLSARYWREILNEQYFFNRSEVIGAAIKNISKDELSNYFKEILSASSPNRRKLAIYMYSNKDKNMINKQAGNGSQKYIKVTDAANFKSSLPVYEMPIPFMNDPPVGAIV